MTCTATLQTAAVEFCGPEPCLDDETCIPYGDGWSHVTVHTLACNDHIHDALTDEPAHRSLEPWAEWTDSTPGARPHTPPLVSDAEQEAAQHAGNAYGWDYGLTDVEYAESILDVLEAAARVRQGSSDPSDAEIQAIALAWMDDTGHTMTEARARTLAEAAARARGDGQ